MAHVREGVLRRLVDEPFAVPDAVADHVGRCRRCTARRERVTRDLAAARLLITRPHPAPDVDRAWARLSRATEAEVPAGAELPRHVPTARRRWRLMGTTVSGGAVVALSGALLVGAAAAATLTTTVFAPTKVAPVPVTQSDLHAFAQVLGLETSTAAANQPGTASTGVGSRWAFGNIEWTASPQVAQEGSLQAAEAATGLRVALPSSLPAGVEGPPGFLAVRAASAVVHFDTAAGPSLAGSTLDVALGPAVVVEYGGASADLAAGLPTLAVVAMQRPSATSSGATAAQLESFVLAEPGFPTDLARQIRLLGNLETALPVPTPPGASETSLSIAGEPAVMVSEPGGVASAVVWEDHSGVVHVVGGLLDETDVLGVAHQLG